MRRRGGVGSGVPAGRAAATALVALALPLLQAGLDARGARAEEPPPQKQAKQQQPPQAATPAMPDAAAIVVLVRSALLSLNDAVQTGNFTVLRDRAAPGFREANTAARLSRIFAGLMRDGADLSGVAMAPPRLGEAPVIDPGSGMLQIRGHFELPGQRLDFSLAFQHVRGRWLLFGIYAQPASLAAGVPSPDEKAAPTD